MTRETLDWKNLNFEYIQTKSFIKFVHRNGQWDKGTLESDPHLQLPLCATALHYGQTCFEGLKAFHMKDGKVRIFRPDLNAQRLQQSCESISVEPVPTNLFLDAVKRVVQDNIEFVPPYGSNGSLYIRPFVLGSAAEIGLSPSKETLFIVFVVPVGDYYKGGVDKKVNALIQFGFDRAAPYGTGHVKLGGNYAPCLAPSLKAKHKGYPITLFLDARESKYIEEFSSSNFVALTAPDVNGKRTFVTPRSHSILPSITNRSLAHIAQAHFGWHVERRKVSWKELHEQNIFDEIAAVGTAAVITPIGEIHREIPTGKFIDQSVSCSELTSEELLWKDLEPIPELTTQVVKLTKGIDGLKQLYAAYRAIQTGDLNDSQFNHWMWPMEGLSLNKELV